MIKRLKRIRDFLLREVTERFRLTTNCQNKDVQEKKCQKSGGIGRKACSKRMLNFSNLQSTDTYTSLDLHNRFQSKHCRCFFCFFSFFFWTALGLHCVCEHSLVVARWVYSLAGCVGFLLDWFSCCGLWALGAWVSAVVVHGLSCPRHVETSWVRDATGFPCIGRQILNHWTTGKVQGGC